MTQTEQVSIGGYAFILEKAAAEALEAAADATASPRWPISKA